MVFGTKPERACEGRARIGGGFREEGKLMREYLTNSFGNRGYSVLVLVCKQNHKPNI